ncbi:MAG: sulfatase-like hydrolase/transferase [Limisphaerales bacterium]
MSLTKHAAFIACIICALAGSASAATRPNILVLLTDDVGWGDYQCYNAQGKIPSPNVDRLAREGMRFTHAHTPAALCAPTRYAMLTGNYPWRGREPGGTWGFNVPAQFRDGQKTVANMLQEAGYRTAMFGKSGTGGKHADKNGGPDFTQPMSDGPKRWGFDYSFIIPCGHQAKPNLFLENELPSCGADKLLRGVAKGKGPDDADYSEPGWKASEVGGRLLDHAEKFLDDVTARNRAGGTNAPFFMHFCADGAHAPYEPAEAVRGTPLRDQTKMNAHTDMVMETDVLLAKLREMLEKRGLLDNTLICLTSDNGGIPSERHLGHDAVGGLRGLKSNITEGGHRVPFIVWMPGRIAPGVRHQVVCAHDIVPTALEFAGVKIPDGQCLDSVSLLPVLLGQRDDSQPVRRSLLVQSAPGRDAFYDAGIKGGPLTGSEKKGGNLFGHERVDSKSANKAKRSNSGSDGMAHALYEGNWKLIVDIKDQPAALYDLKADLVEEKNLIADPAQTDRVKKMEETYRAIRASKKGSRWISLTGRTPLKQAAVTGSDKAEAGPGRTGTALEKAAPSKGETHVYKKVGDRELKLTILKPDGWKATDRRPAVVFFHGGGWVGGGPTQFDVQAAYLATRGMVCAQVEYRLLDKSGKEPPLVCVQDAKSSMRWVRAHAAELGIDPKRIGAGGGSAGGHLAAFVGLVDGQSDPQDDAGVSPKADALLLFNPVFDNGPDGGWGHARVGDRVKEFSPAHNISADDPPAIVFLGRNDNLIPVATVERFQSNMKAAGVRCEAIFYDQQGHGFFNQEPFKTKTLAEADKFLASLGWLSGPPTLKEADSTSTPPPVAKKGKKNAASKQGNP